MPDQNKETSPREQGKSAYREGKDRETNPYARDTPEWLEWLEGWIWCSVHYPRRR